MNFSKLRKHHILSKVFSFKHFYLPYCCALLWLSIGKYYLISP